MTSASQITEPLWSRALGARAVEVVRKNNRGARARLALSALLARAGQPVSLTVIRRWPRHVHGEAYLWAIAFVEGREDIPAPSFLVEAVR
jgi:hypothetical protein